MIETKKMLATERREEKTTRWNKLKFMEDEKWRAKLAAQTRKMKTEDRNIRLEEERLAKEKKAEGGRRNVDKTKVST